MQFYQLTENNFLIDNPKLGDTSSSLFLLRRTCKVRRVIQNEVP